MPPVAILAGGLGTRLGARSAALPKALVEVAGEPFVLHVLRRLRRSGITRAVLCVGHLGEQIEGALGARSCGLELAYSFDSPGLDGTLGALRRARALLGDRFLVHYGDTILTLDLPGLVNAWEASGLPAMLAVLENRGRWGPSNCEVSAGLVVSHDKSDPTPAMEWIDYGVCGLTAASLDTVPSSESDLSALYAALARQKLIAAFPVLKRFYEIGSPAALAETEQFLLSESGRC